jgi:iron(III) transport system ATP-binding protein
MTAAISLLGVRFGYDARDVLSDVSLTLERGQVIALLGPSGSGKSTVLRIILGLAAPAAGTVRLDEEVVSESGRVVVPPERRRLAVVFQDLALWPHLTVRGNLSFGLAARGVPRPDREARVTEMLDRLSLGDKADRYPGNLSGGERQRVAIGRALVQEPRAVLLDEPLSNLDVTLKRELLLLFRGLFQEQRSTAIYVTHDLREAALLSDRIAVIEAGRIVQVGSVGDLREQPASPFVGCLVEDLQWQAPVQA